MIKLLYGVSVLAMVGSGILFTHCGLQWWRGAPEEGNVPYVSPQERARRPGTPSTDQGPEAVSPLVAQAMAFALYLNPPKPPASPPAPRPRVNPAPAPRPVAVTPQFRLLSTSCHHSHPEQSLALVSEPSKETRWVKKGDHLGHLVVEGIRDGTLVYRDGGQLREMTIAVRQTAELARVASAPSATPGVRPGVRLTQALQTPVSGRPGPDAAPVRHE
jgi:hypothetical protein